MTPTLFAVALALAATPQAEAAAETPAAETPAAETPPTEAPAAEAPAGETAPSEAAAAETAPTADEPAADTSAESAIGAAANTGSGPKEGETNLYVMDPQVVELSESVAKTVSATIAQTIQEEGLNVFSRDDVRDILGQATDLASLGSDADSLSLGSLGSAVGAQYIVTAVVSAVDDDVVVQTRLIEVAKSKVLERRESKASDHDGEILEAIKVGTRLILAPLFADMKGTLSVKVSEEGANVLIDDRQIGVSPIDEALTLPGGYHTLTVTKEGFIRHQESFRVEKGAAITSDVSLRPSLEFMQKWRARGELYGTLAWSSAGATAALVGGAVAFGGLYYYFGFMETERLTAVRDQIVADESLNPAIPEHENRINELNAPIIEAGNTGVLMSIVGGALGAVGVATAFTSIYFFVFGNDANKYAEFENAVE
jgi:hypothetical protein